jgi:hypothetical protein
MKIAEIKYLTVAERQAKYGKAIAEEAARSEQSAKPSRVPISANHFKLVPSASADGSREVDQFAGPKTVIWISGAEKQDLSKFIGAARWSGEYDI